MSDTANTDSVKDSAKTVCDTQINEAVAAGKLTAPAAENIRKWLSESRFSDYAAEVRRHIDEGLWQALDDAFWTVIPFGTGGRRGRMYPIGCNVINDRTIGESAQGLADYIRDEVGGDSLSCAIAYDTRHNSRHFAELCASVMTAAGFHVYFLDDYRSTPELSYLVRAKNCSCGIMVTASHNPPSDNAVKVYWSSGAQILPPHDSRIIERVGSVQAITVKDFSQSIADGQVTMCKDEIDVAYVAAAAAEGFQGPRDINIIFSPLHGVGESSVVPVLAADGFQSVEIFGPHQKPDGDFPNVPGHVSNPENPRVFDAMIDRAKESGAEIALATDPDADRMGCAAPLKLGDAEWKPLTGNQLGALLADYVLEQRKSGGGLTPEHFIATTLVTTEMLRRIADSYGVTTYGNLQVGFKWICSQVDESGPDLFLYGTEESHGFLVGQYARDKDGAVACMLLAELAAKLKAEGLSLHEKLDSLYWQHGLHAECLVNVMMEGSQGMARMQALMERLREDPPSSFGGIDYAQRRDYLLKTTISADGSSQPLDGPDGNLIVFDLAETGNRIAIRPSGTEPKVKFYMFGYTAPEQLANLDRAKEELAERLKTFETDVRSLADSV